MGKKLNYSLLRRLEKSHKLRTYSVAALLNDCLTAFAILSDIDGHAWGIKGLTALSAVNGWLVCLAWHLWHPFQTHVSLYF